VRKGTLVVVVLLFLLIGGAAVYQLMLAGRGRERFPGPVPGTPYPTSIASP
jgi:hypothetical protein